MCHEKRSVVSFGLVMVRERIPTSGESWTKSDASTTNCQRQAERLTATPEKAFAEETRVVKATSVNFIFSKESRID
jgi:hypothetical protein